MESQGVVKEYAPVSGDSDAGNLILLDLTITLLLHLGTVTDVAKMRPLSAHFDCARNRMCQGRM